MDTLNIIINTDLKSKLLRPKLNQWECVSVTIKEETHILDNKIIEKVSEYKYLGYTILDRIRCMEIKLQSYNKINDVIKISSSRNMLSVTDTSKRHHSKNIFEIL
jgi:predicted SPOUT superfamily RNA methylase MTH1